MVNCPYRPSEGAIKELPSLWQELIALERRLGTMRINPRTVNRIYTAKDKFSILKELEKAV